MEKSYIKNGYLLTLAFLFFSVLLFSQNVKVSGIVYDQEMNETLPGVTIVEKGTTNGTVTSIDGGYSLEVASNAVLVFSFVGYDNLEYAVINGNKFDAYLNVKSELLDEVLVIGYGTQKKTDKTGAVSLIKAEELNIGVLTDPIQAMQGKVSGVMVTKKGGDPNAGFSVKIRGASGFGSGTEPLYVVDGVPGVDPTTIASEDIESFNVLKDASSTAIYGARGANGIIMITTKKGIKGTAGKGSKVEYNSYVSMDNVANRLDLLSADEVRDYVDLYDIDFTDAGGDTDWQDEIYRTGISHSHNVSVSGEHEGTNYFTSLTHTNFDGVIKGTRKKRTMGRINLSQKGLNDKLTVTTGLSGTIEENDYISYGGWGTHDVLYQAFRRTPTDFVTNEDGSFVENDKMFNSKNPVATIDEIQNERSAKRFLGNLKADLEIVDGLILGTNLAYIRDDAESFYFLPTYSYNAGEGHASRSYGNYENKLAEGTIKYVKSINDEHHINAVLGYSYQEEGWDGFNAGGDNPASNYVTSNNLGLLQNVLPGDIGSYKNGAKLISFFGRAVYNYQSKYYLTGTVRRDGSSKFGNNKEWGWFPSGAFAWNLKQEGFLSDVDFISDLKFRVSYGKTGNQDIGLYLDRTIMRPSGSAIDPETGETVISFEGDKNPNPDLQWEENHELNFGLDFGFMKSRISGSVEYYNKKINHLAYGYTVPVPPNQYPTTFANYGALNNSGVEIDIHAFVVDKKNADWKSSFTFSTNTQNVQSLDGGEYGLTSIPVGYISGPGLVGGENYSQLIKTGYELGTFYLPEYATLADDGAFLFYTETGGVTRDIELAERRVVGNALPDYEFGWSNQIVFYKNIELNFAFRAVVGYDVLNVTRMVFGNTNGLMPNGNVLHSALDEKERGLSSSPTLSSYYVEDASFLRLDNLTLAYNFDTKKINGISRLKVYFTSNNLWLLTGYSGIDPEITYQGLSFGIDQYNVYPKTRTYTFGLNVTF